MTLIENGMTKTLLDDLPLSDETKRRLQDVATRHQRSDAEAEVVVDAIEDYLAADEDEARILAERLKEADAGGPFARNADVQRWLKSWDTENELEPPKADIHL